MWTYFFTWEFITNYNTVNTTKLAKGDDAELYNNFLKFTKKHTQSTLDTATTPCFDINDIWRFKITLNRYDDISERERERKG